MSHDLQLSYSSMWLTMGVISASLLVGVGFRPSGLRTWTAALVWQALGWGLLTLGAVHEASRWMSAAIGVAALAGSTTCMLLTASHYLHRPLARHWIFGPPVAAFALHLATARFESFQMALVSLIVAAQFGWIAWLLVPKRREELAVRWRWLASGGYGLATGIVAVPTLLYLLLPAYTVPQSHASWSDVFTSVVVNGWAIVALVCTLAFLLAHRDEAEQALRRLANRDGLTGLLNRRAFMERGEAQLAQHHREQRSVAAIIIDLDHFKRINDGHGHAMGDAVIELFAKVLLECVETGTLVDRHGGEEFCVLLPGGLAAARAMDRQLRTRLPQAALVALGFAFDFSAGAAAPSAGTDETLAHLIGRADRALYAAKHAGRGQMAVDEGVAGQRLAPAAQAELVA